MALRLIDSETFRNPFVRGLDAPLKLLYIYLICEASHSGIWTVELDVAKLRCDVPQSVTSDQILKAFAGKVYLLDGGAKWFIPKYVEIQHKNNLSETNPAQKKALIELLKYDLIEAYESGKYRLKDRYMKAPSEGLQSPLQGVVRIGVEVKEGVSIEKEKEKREKIKKEPEIQFAEFVKLTQKEYDSLHESHTVDDVKAMIKILDNYKGSSGKKYKSDYRAILSWVVGKYETEIKTKFNNNGNQSSEQQSKQRLTDAYRIIDQMPRS